jgi:C-terminal processing protease CtpA/Prc/Tol biopolymer transport system component
MKTFLFLNFKPQKIIRMHRTFILILLAFVLHLSLKSQEDIFLRDPQLSPSGNTILFTSQGDIWMSDISGGQATRITSHQSDDRFPVWADNENQIAFSSDRFGNYDIFTINLKNGSAHQLTYHASHDLTRQWYNDQIIFSSSRFLQQVEHERELMHISVKGGTPERIMNALGFEARISPDGNLIAFVRGSCRVAREAYQGPANRDIWIYNQKKDTFFQVTKDLGNDYSPHWADANTLFFISARTGRYNIFSISIHDDGKANGQPVPVTRVTDMGIRSFSLAGNGQIIAYAKGKDIYIQQADRQPEKLRVILTNDQTKEQITFKTFKDHLSRYEVSPDSKEVALIIHGRLFVKGNSPKLKKTSLLIDSHERIRDIAWLDNQTLIYSSDKYNQYDLFMLTPEDTGKRLFQNHHFKIERLTNTPDEEIHIATAPDHHHIAFTRNNGTLITGIIDKKGIQKQQVLLDGWASPSTISWSPDSQWLAYSLSDLNGNREIFIQKADNSSAPVNVSMHPRSDFKPVWGNNKLAFLSMRNNGDTDLWFVWLRKNDWEKTKDDWLEAEVFTEKDTADPGGFSGVEPEAIYKRAVQVTGLPGNEAELQISPDGQYFYFVTNQNARNSYKAERDLYKIKWDGSELKALTSGNKNPDQLTFHASSKQLYMRSPKGTLSQINPQNGNITALPFSAAFKLNYQKQREQMFDEAWRALKISFYDPDFHGQDWEKLYQEYKPLCMSTRTNIEFGYCFNLMLGQVNASHMGMQNIQKMYNNPNHHTGYLGIDIRPESEGIRILRVLDETPASRLTSRLHVGDVITHVNGVPVNINHNFYKPLTEKINQDVVLTIKNDNKTSEIIIRPQKSIQEQQYNDWVKMRRTLTEKYSDGRLGYLHIRGMNWSSFERFERELTAAAEGKEGIVIDVRFNGGGWTTDYLMAILNTRQHAYTIPRGAATNLSEEHSKFVNYYPFGERLPFYAWNKPSIALCNQNSYSNAEIFSHAYKSLGIGTLVGTPTFGAVISTGAQRLIDGSYVRIPFRAWYVKNTGKNMENHPAVPDVIVENNPDSKSKGQDPQLKKAVTLLLNQIDNQHKTN